MDITGQKKRIDDGRETLRKGYILRPWTLQTIQARGEKKQNIN
jgi:hypothetical protein